MPVWPEITEPELRARFALTDEDFGAATAAGLLQVPPRPYEAAVLERAIGYPWWRPPVPTFSVMGRCSCWRTRHRMSARLFLGGS